MERPSRHHGIIRHDQESGQDEKQPHHAPKPVSRELVQGTGGVSAPAASDRHLRQQHRQPRNQQTDDEQQEECRSPVLSRDIGKLPHVAEPDRTADRGQNEAG